jgi:hypothetical protein
MSMMIPARPAFATCSHRNALPPREPANYSCAPVSRANTILPPPVGNTLTISAVTR